MGVIGRIVVPWLARDAQVTALDCEPAGPTRVSGVTYVQGSVGDESLMDELMADSSHVVHLARGNPATWKSLLDVDLTGTRTTLDAAARNAVKRVVLASSNNVCAGDEADLLRGQGNGIAAGKAFSSPRPTTLYGVAKLFVENYGRYIAETTSVAVSCLRIGVVRSVDDPSRYVDEAGFSWIPGGRDGVARRLRSTWLCHDDLLTFVDDELRAPDKFRVRFAMSSGQEGYWPIEVARWNPAPSP